MRRLSSRFTFLALLVIAMLALFVAGRPATAAAAADSVLHVEVTGHGRPMILIPGLCTSGEVWSGVVAHFRDHYECHVVTLGGFAGTPPYRGPFLDGARDALLAYIHRKHLSDPVLVGHSLGGVIALELAIARPDAIGPLVILDSMPFLGGALRSDATAESARAAYGPMHDLIRNQTQEAYAAYQEQSPFLAAMVTAPSDLARVKAWAKVSDHVSVADAFYETATVDVRDALAGVHSPALVLATWYGMKATTTRAIVDSSFRAQYAKLARCTIAVADSAKHFVMLDAPDWTLGRIDGFLAEQHAAVEPVPKRP